MTKGGETSVWEGPTHTAPTPLSLTPSAPTGWTTPGPRSACPRFRLMSENPIGPLLGQVLSLDQSAMVGGGALSAG